MITLDIIETHAKSNPNNIAVEENNDQLSWTEYASSVKKISGWLNERIGNKTAVAAIDAPASISVFIIASALSTVQVPWVAIDTSSFDGESKLKKLDPDLIVFQNDQGVLNVQFSDTGEIYEPTHSVSEGSVANIDRKFLALGFTSGTTGVPKMVIRRKPSERRRNNYLIDRFKFGCQDRFLLCLPLSHASGHGWARTFLTAGATVVIGRNNSNDILDKILTNNISATLVVPPMLEDVCRVANEKKNFNSESQNLKFLLTGGRHLSSRLISKVNCLFGPVLHLYYGTTETGINTIAEPRDLIADPRTSGAPIEGNDIRILDSNNITQPVFTPGRIAISSYMNADCYDTAEIPKVSLCDKMFNLTADTGYLNAFGQLRVLGRVGGGDNFKAFGDLIGFEQDIQSIDNVKSVAVSVPRESNRVDVFVQVKKDKIKESIIRGMMINAAKAREVDLELSIHVVPEIQYNSTGKFDVSNTKLSVRHN